MGVGCDLGRGRLGLGVLGKEGIGWRRLALIWNWVLVTNWLMEGLGSAQAGVGWTLVGSSWPSKGFESAQANIIWSWVG